MKKCSIKDYASYLKNKNELQKSFKNAILDTLKDMGDDAKGITWFSSNSNKPADQYKLAS